MQVSIIMPYYNAAKYIKETVSSIIAQTYKDWELIIVNDCSTDPETDKVIGEVQSLDCRISIISATRNGGAGIARNIGIKAAQGRYIAFCDSDDWWYPTKLEEQHNFMQQNGYEFTCTYYEDTNEKLEPHLTRKPIDKQCFKSMITDCNIGTPGAMFDTKRIGKKFMPELRRAEDWGLWINILKDADYCYVYPKVLWKYRHIQGSGSSNKWKQIKAVARMYEMVLGYSRFKSLTTCLFVFLPMNVLKKIKKYIL